MKCGFSSNAFTKFSIFDAIQSISKIGYDGIEIVLDSPHAFLPLHDIEIKKIKNSLQKHNLCVTNLNSNTVSGFSSIENPFEPSLSNNNEKLRNWRISYTKQAIDFASLVNAPSVCITSGLYNEQDRFTELKNFEKSLMVLGAYAEQKRVILAIEYEPGLLIENSNDVWKIVSTDFKNIGLNLDTCHAAVIGENIPEIINKFGKKIFHTHVSDCKNNVHFHLLPGLGEINFHELIDSLKKIKYDGFLTAELYPYFENPNDAASNAFIYLKNLIK